MQTVSVLPAGSFPSGQCGTPPLVRIQALRKQTVCSLGGRWLSLFHLVNESRFMATNVDVYAPCPCGSGKKIKFCCRDLAPEFERIGQMLEGGQRKACLEHVERLLQKHPQNRFLRSLQIELLYALEEYDRGDELIQQWVKQQPENPIPLGWSAVSLLSQAYEEEDDQQARKLFRTALLWLQRAFQFSQDSVPVTVIRALTLAVRLGVEREWFFPAVGHLAIARMLDVGNAEELAELFAGALVEQGIPLPVRMFLVDSLPQHPQGAEIPGWEDIQNHVLRGRFLQAEQQLAELAEQRPEDDRCWYYLGLMRAYLGDDPRAVEAWNRCAEATSSPHRRIEALALALCAQGVFSEGPEHVGVEIPVEDADALLEQLQALPQLRPTPARLPALNLERMFEGAAEDAVDETSPPPRASFDIVDAEAVEEGEGKSPVSVGLLLLYGKETDRPARVQMIGTRWKTEESPPEWKAIAEQVPQLRWRPEDVIGMGTSPFHRWLSPRLIERESLDPAQKIRFYEYRLRRWTESHRLPQLGNRTVAEAARDAQSRDLAQAMLLLVEGYSDEGWLLPAVDVDALRRELGLEPPPPVRAETEEELAWISPCWLHRLDTSAFTVPMWERALNKARLLAFRRAARNLALACLDTEVWKQAPALAQQVAKALIEAEPEPEKAREQVEAIYQEIKNRTEFDENACAVWDGLRLGALMRSGPQYVPQMVEIADHILHTHRRHPEAVAVATQAMSLVQMVAQLIQSAQGQQEQQAPVPREESGLWTPDQGQPPVAKPQKLWTPD